MDVTEQELIEAARKLSKPEFSRAELAEQLGVTRADVKESFRAARDSGHFERAGEDDQGTRLFRLAES